MGDDPTRGEQPGEEFAVVDIGRSGRHVVRDLPSHCREGSLPGGDVMVVSFRDHTIEIEKNCFQPHDL